MKRYKINPDITKAETLPASFYQSQEVLDILVNNVFDKCWHWLGSSLDLLPLSGYTYPLDLYGEQVVLVKNSEGEIKCLSNVCTHRGNIIVHHPGKEKHLICKYHGRRFDMDGKFRFMPEFKEALNFPRPCDHLHQFQLSHWFSHLFVSLDPSFDLKETLDTLNERVGFLPIDQYKLDLSHGKEYIVNCHWALYCDNYLEGFHIPFVHEDLNEALDYGQYETKLYDHMTLQIGYTDQAEDVFTLPEGHPDFGRNVSAYYYWIFPNVMLNFYPWGLSVNVVKPISLNKTKVSFISYIYDESKLAQGSGALLDKVEREDEFVVEGVHKGLKSKFYESGRFSPKREKGVHHFHWLLAEYLSKEVDSRG
ncbi:aromatic ring-hydroxylating oxygenase subunit alpha [Portibacter lacus]|uniref:Choline monooxygenase n=1 Tax=Portibacter lacus TaxID=1099794 RepID=A0AA37SV88_9BACT|nr:aromatic ring-hydroxylating dioxygenase subunit alpha [Portibacter lacus]GLR19855.1 choline monooxygenase [Portibacter lacus]